MVIKIFCLSILWMALGLFSIPVFYPLLALEKEVEGGMLGFIMCIPSICSIVMIPLIKRVAHSIGIELTICIAGLMFGSAFIAFAMSYLIEDRGAFIALCCFLSLIIGAS